MSYDPAQLVSEPAPGRSCGTCTLCCKVFDVPAIDKAAGQWCRHCTPGGGCGIYETRPQQCRSFHCMWMTTDFLGPEWKPEKAKFVLVTDPATLNLLVQVDPGQPKAWQVQPYYQQLKRWAQAALAESKHVIVFNGKAATVVLPDKDVALGVIAPDDRIVFQRRDTLHGLLVDVRKVKAGAA
jgi:hypothetical protein